MSARIATRNIALAVVGASALWKANQYVKSQATAHEAYNLNVHPEPDDEHDCLMDRTKLKRDMEKKKPWNLSAADKAASAAGQSHA